MEPAVLEIGEPQTTTTAPAPILGAGAAITERRDAWEEFTARPMPKRTDESWRFANLKRLDLSTFTRPLPIADSARQELIARSRGVTPPAGRMVFGNDRLLLREVLSDSLRQQGVLWLPLEQAEAEHPELVAQYFMREEAILGGQKFAALHRSQVRTGTFLYVPKGVEIDLPVKAFHWLYGAGGSCFPHTLIVAEEMAKMTMIDYFRSADADAPGFACGVNDLWLGRGAQVTYIGVQDWSRQALALQMNATVVGRDAFARALSLNLGGSYARSESVSHLRGPGGRSDMLAVTVARGTQEFDQRTFQIHESPNTASDLLYKNSLDDQSRTIFSGLIRVDPGAHKTDAFQKVRNLLLSDEAEANSAPGLEIEADDVRCTHGATSGQIEQEELFYLLSRGIAKTAAQRLIVIGFLEDVFERLPDEAIRARLRELLEEKFIARL
jgi:Fe-S cluster assembly protein SufD